MKSTDFSTWVTLDFNWSEIAWQYNTGKKFQSKQDLVSVFWNGYNYYEMKLNGYFNEFGELPIDFLNELIFKFRQNFPLSNRIKGINYFDDLLIQLIEKLKSTNNINKTVNESYWLTSFENNEAQNTPLYKNYQKEIKNKGWLIIKTKTENVKVYTPELAYILTSKQLTALNTETQKETNLNGFKYLNTYIEAYKEGEQYFETEFKVSPNTLYGANAEQYVRDIHLNFFHVKHTGINEGWGYVKKQYPLILNHKAIKEFGYYSGIVNKVEEQVKKHPRLFATFDKCEHNLPPQQTTNEKETLRYRAKHYVLAYIIECNAKGESFPIGQKKELEKIGNEKMGKGKGNRFYKVFNEITNNYDINKPNHLIEISGENWRTIVKDLSNEPEKIEIYLQNKQL